MQRGCGSVLPQAGFGILDGSVATDPDHALKVGRPLGSDDGVVDIENLGVSVFAAITGKILGQDLVNGRFCFRHGEDALEQVGLVLLQLDQQVTTRLTRCLEGFFGPKVY